MNTGQDPAAEKDQLLRARILDRAVGLMGQPEVFRNLTIGEVAEQSGIAASTILSQSSLGVDGDQAGAADEFRRLLLHRLIRDLEIKLPMGTRDELVAAVSRRQPIPELIAALIEPLSDQFCSNGRVDYLLAASRRSENDPELAALVEAKWNEITDEAAFVLQLVLASYGHRLGATIGHAELAGLVALALMAEFMQCKLLGPLDAPAIEREGVPLGPGAFLIWSLIEPEINDPKDDA